MSPQPKEDWHKWINTLLVPIVGFLIGMQLSDIKSDISDLSIRMDRHDMMEKNLELRVQHLEDKTGTTPPSQTSYSQANKEALLPERIKISQ